MLIYVESKAFAHRTFVLSLNQLDTIARARAQMLHVLYEMDRSNHQFRFRFKGTYLRDAYTFEDYKILDSSVIKMVPMAKSRREMMIDSNLAASNVKNLYSDIGGDMMDEHEKIRAAMVDDVQLALLKEVAIFTRRETLISAFRVFLWIHFLAFLLSFSTVYWWSFSWTGVIVIYGLHYCPQYSRLTGFMGASHISKELYLASFFIAMILNLVASFLMAYFLLNDAIYHGCADYTGDCGYQNLWSIIMYISHILASIISNILIILMAKNFKVQVGDVIEYYLIQNKDVAKVLSLAKLGSLKERRNAAFELASLAATGEDAKFKIVSNEGLTVLQNLSLCSDETTSEYATEALAELLTVTNIQDMFIDLGGARTLCALLHSRSIRLHNEAVMAISYVVADSERNKHAIVADDGLQDLSFAATKAGPHAAQIIAGIYLEISFSQDIRRTLAMDEHSAAALIHLCKSREDETKRLALQTMELLAIENPDFIIEQESLLDYLIEVPLRIYDDQICLLAAKIILYYAETHQTCSILIGKHSLQATLMQLAYNPDTVLQSVVAKIVLGILDNTIDKQEVLGIGIIEVLAYLHENCMERETSEMAMRAIDILHGFALSLQPASMDDDEGKDDKANENVTTLRKQSTHTKMRRITEGSGSFALVSA